MVGMKEGMGLFSAGFSPHLFAMSKEVICGF